MDILADSTIIIDHFNGIAKADEFILTNKNRLYLSVITRAESLVGLDEASAVQAKIFLDFFPTLSLTAEDADTAALLRRTEKWKLPDAFQAALAKNHGLKFATRNSKDFHPSHHKFVIIPYHLT